MRLLSLWIGYWLVEELYTSLSFGEVSIVACAEIRIYSMA